MEVTESLKGFGFKAFIVFFSLCTLLWLSIIFYGLLYYLYIPAVAHIRPVHLQYDMSCFKEKQCCPKFPSDNITLIESGNEFLRGRQGYAVELVLEMPESERNWIQGIFMIKLDMLNYEGRLIKSTRRAAMLRYRSPLFKTVYTLFFLPGLLAGSFEEKQSLVVPLFEEYIEDSYNSAHFAHIQIEAQTIEIYSSVLRIHAQFTGLRYLMYYWPVISAIIGVGGSFLFLVTTISLIWFYESTKTSSDEVSLGWPRRLTQHEQRSKRTDESQIDRTLQSVAHVADVSSSEREDLENQPNDNEPDNNESQPMEMGIIRRTQELDIEHLEPLDGETSQVEDIDGNERENIDIENLPRRRATGINNFIGDDPDD